MSDGSQFGQLLDEALEATFPASNPVAITVEQGESKNKNMHRLSGSRNPVSAK
jgi:hypothetical protein